MTTAVNRAITVEHLVKSYAGTKALDDVSLDINAGELFGFIGPDGAGKTTLFRILVTLLVPDSGSATRCWCVATAGTRASLESADICCAEHNGCPLETILDM